MFKKKAETSAEEKERLRLQEETLKQNKQATAERRAAATAAAAAAIAAATDINALRDIIVNAKKKADIANVSITTERHYRSLGIMKEHQVPLLRKKNLSDEDKRIVDTAEVNIPTIFQEMEKIKASAEDKARQVSNYLDTSKTMTDISAMRSLATLATNAASDVESLPAEFEQKLNDFRAEINKLTDLMTKYSDAAAAAAAAPPPVPVPVTADTADTPVVAAAPAAPPVETDYSKEDETLVPIFVKPNQDFNSVDTNPQIGGFYDSPSPVSASPAGADKKARKPYRQYYDPKEYTIEFDTEKNVWIVKKINGSGTSFEIRPLNLNCKTIVPIKNPQISLVDMDNVELTQTSTASTAPTAACNCNIYRAILLQDSGSSSVKNGWYFNGLVKLRTEAVVSRPMLYHPGTGINDEAEYMQHAIFEVNDNDSKKRNVLPSVPVGSFTCRKVHSPLTTEPHYDVFKYGNDNRGGPYHSNILLDFVESVLASKNIDELKGALESTGPYNLTEYTQNKALKIEYVSSDNGLDKIAEIIQATTDHEFTTELSVFVVPSTRSGVYNGCAPGESGVKVKGIMNGMYEEFVKDPVTGSKLTFFPMTMMLSVNLGITGFMIENRPGANGIPLSEGFDNLRDVYANPLSEGGRKGNFTLKDFFKQGEISTFDYDKFKEKTIDKEFWKNNLIALIERNMVSFMRIRKVQGGIKSDLFTDIVKKEKKPKSLSKLIGDAANLYNKPSNESQKYNQISKDTYSDGILACNFAYCVGDLDVSDINAATLSNDDIMIIRYKVLLCMHLSQYLSVIDLAVDQTASLDRNTTPKSKRKINLYIPPLITNDDIRKHPTYQRIVALALASAVSIASNMYKDSTFVVKFLSNAVDTDTAGYKILLPSPMTYTINPEDIDGGSISKSSTKNHKKTKKNNTKKSKSKSKKNKIKFL
jgi:hypothetical protein